MKQCWVRKLTEHLLGGEERERVGGDCGEERRGIGNLEIIELEEARLGLGADHHHRLDHGRRR